MNTFLLQDAVRQLAAELPQISPSDRGARIRQLAAQAGVSLATVYRHLERAGVTSDRKARSDRGQSSVPVGVLEQLALIMATGRNKRSQPNIPLKQAVAIAREQGILTTDVSYEHVARLLRQHGLGLQHMRAPEASVVRVSTHPNHVWLFDISVAIQWYFRDEKGKKLDQYSDAGSRFYAGKPDNFRTVRRVIHRFTVVDHYTGAYWVQYRYTPGESALDVVDFLWSAMAPKEGDRLPMHGLPRRLVADQGPGVKNATVLNLLRDLDIAVELHAPGNAKASGAVEKRHDLWQRSFEGRLALHPVNDLDELNHLAGLACAKMNATVEHTRHGQPPSRLWLTIAPEQLREPPDRQTFFALAGEGTREATLNSYLWLRADGKKWSVKGANVFPGQKVRFRLHPFLPSGIRVWDEHDVELVAVPLTFDAAGFAEQGSRHVWDDADAKGATAPAPPAQALARAAAESPVRMPGVFDDLVELERLDIVARRRGTPFQAPASSSAVREYDDLLAREEVVRRLGRALSRPEATWWRQHVGAAGITRAELDELFVAFTTSVATTAAAR